MEAPHTQHPYTYVANNPVNYVDPYGWFTPWDIIDIGSFLWSLADFIDCPSWANAGWLALDAPGLLPLVPALGVIGKFDDASKLAIKMNEVREMGRIGETLSGILKNKERIEAIVSSAHYRIPDNLDRTKSLLQEVKNVKRLSYTRQLKDFLAYAKKEDYVFELLVREGTIISKSLQDLIKNDEIILKRILP